MTTPSSPQAQHGPVLDQLAALRPSAKVRMADATQAVGRQPGLLVAVLGRLQAADVADLSRALPPASRGFAVLLDVDGWRVDSPTVQPRSQGRWLATPAGEEPEGVARQAALLRAAGWTAVVASVTESVPTVWQRLGTQLHGRRSAWSAARRGGRPGRDGRSGRTGRGRRRMTGTWPDSRLTLWAWASSLAVCISLGPLVAEKGFLLAGALAGAGVALVGLLGRRLNVPIVVLVVAQLWWLVTWLTFSYAPSTAVAGLLPTQETVTGLRALVEQALTTANESAPPAPSNEGIEASLGLVMGLVAVVVDLLAVSWRRPALVGLVFLGVYMAPVALLAGEVPVLAFAPGALMFVLLLGAEQRDRLSHWGRQISITGSLLSVRDREQVTLTSLAQSGRRVGLGAVALAVVLPLFVPTLPRTFLADGPLSGGQGLGEGDGDGTVRVENRCSICAATSASAAPRCSRRS
jgi:hypothetical protein